GADRDRQRVSERHRRKVDVAVHDVEEHDQGNRDQRDLHPPKGGDPMKRHRPVSKAISRRHILRGAGVALALPWLPSLEPRGVHAAQAAPARRFIPIYLPNGASTLWWRTTGSGAGDAWQLSPLLSP